MLRLPWGLREMVCDCACPGLSAGLPHSSANTTAAAKQNFATESNSPKDVATSSQIEMHFWGQDRWAFYAYRPEREIRRIDEVAGGVVVSKRHTLGDRLPQRHNRLQATGSQI